MSIRSLDDLASVLGPGSEAVADLQRLFALARGYGYEDWLVFDPSVVRGLAYYTGEGSAWGLGEVWVLHLWASPLARLL